MSWTRRVRGEEHKVRVLVSIPIFWKPGTSHNFLEAWHKSGKFEYHLARVEKPKQSIAVEHLALPVGEGGGQKCIWRILTLVTHIQIRCLTIYSQERGHLYPDQTVIQAVTSGRGQK